MTKFQTELFKEIKRIRALCAKEGTIALGVHSLFSHLNFGNLPNVPHGTNARYYIKEEIRAMQGNFPNFILMD